MAYIYDLTDTWNAGGTTFYGIKMNVTNTASASGSKLLSLQVGGSEQFGVDKNGTGYFTGNVGIGLVASVKLDVNAGSLGGTAGNSLDLYRVLGYASNLRSLTARLIRNTTGSDWTGTTMRLQNTIDVTNSAYIDFSPNGTHDLALGTGGSPAERVRIDSNGNVGIGTTAPGTRLDVWTPNGTATTVRWAQTGVTNYDWRIPASTDAFTLNYGGTTERMRITSAGNVGIGTNNPVSLLHINGTLTTGNITVRGDGVEGGQITFNNLGNTAGPLTLDVDSDGNGRLFTTVNNANLTLGQLVGTGGYVAISTASSERMRINSSGDMLVNATSDWTGGYSKLYSYTSAASSRTISAYNAGSSAGASAFLGRVDNTAVDLATFYYGASTVVGTITTNGTNTAYNTSSDYRLKDIDGPILNSGAYIDALKPVQGSWKADGSRFIGLIAHEVQEVSETQIATGKRDGEQMQAMDYSAPEIIANLIAEIQSLRARVAQLEGN